MVMKDAGKAAELEAIADLLDMPENISMQEFANRQMQASRRLAALIRMIAAEMASR